MVCKNCLPFLQAVFTFLLVSFKVVLNFDEIEFIFVFCCLDLTPLALPLIS